jgi:hypothetical protein
MPAPAAFHAVQTRSSDQASQAENALLLASREIISVGVGSRVLK